MLTDFGYFSWPLYFTCISGLIFVSEYKMDISDITEPQFTSTPRYIVKCYVLGLNSLYHRICTYLLNLMLLTGTRDISCRPYNHIYIQISVDHGDEVLKVHSTDFFITPQKGSWWAESEIDFFLHFLDPPPWSLKLRFLELSSSGGGGVLKIVKIKKKSISDYAHQNLWGV